MLWGDRLFITCADEASGTRTVACLNSTSGDEVWSRSFPAASHATHELNSLASATPTVDEAHVDVAWGTPEQITVVAIEHDGDVAWQSVVVLAADRAFEELARHQLPEASHATPAVVGDRMYVRTFTQTLCIGAAP